MKKFFIFLFFNSAAVVLLLVLGELLVRIFVPEIRLQGTDKNLFEDNLCFSSAGLKPNSSGLSNGAMIYIDNFGFRKNRTPVDTSKKSILLLGDSAVMGIGVETDSTFSSLLQDMLKTRNVLNPSMFGYNIYDYKNVFECFGSRKELKINEVIICWCLNDIYDSTINDLEIPGRGARYFFADILSFLSRKSYLYTYLKTFFSDRPKAYYLFDSRLYENKWLLNRTVSILNEIKKECSGSNLKFSVLLLPYEYQLRTNNSYPLNLLQKILIENRIEVIDGFPSLKNQKTTPKNFYLYGDGIHFSNSGHKVIAFSLYHKLKN